jgi:hypothetical protein
MCRQSKYSDIRNIPQRTTSSDGVATVSVKKEESKSHSSAHIGVPSADKTSAAASKSTIDINANPEYPAAGKPITQVNIDEGASAPRPCKTQTDKSQIYQKTRSPGANQARISATTSTTVSTSSHGRCMLPSRTISVASSVRTHLPPTTRR